MSYSQNQKRSENALFESTPIIRAVFSLALPAVISALAVTLYGFADAYFLGRGKNPDMLAAVSVCVPLSAAATGISALFGTGGAGVIAASLGKNNIRRAKSAFIFCTAGTTFLSAAFSAGVFLFSDKILPLIGAKKETAEYASSYLLRTVVLGAVPVSLTGCLSQLIRALGKPGISSFGTMLSALLNTALDAVFVLFIYGKGREIYAVGDAFLISAAASCAFFIIYMLFSKNALKNKSFKKDGTKNEGRHIQKGAFSETFRIGFPSAAAIILATFSNIISNFFISSCGSAAVAGLGAAKRLSSLAFNVNTAFSQSILPLISYCFASKNRERMKKAAALNFSAALVLSLLYMAVSLIYAKNIVGLFIGNDKTAEFGAKFLKLLSPAFPMCAASFCICSFLQGCGKPKPSLAVTALRKGTLDVILMYLAFVFGNIYLVALATTVTEAVSATAACIILIRFLKGFQNQRYSSRDSGRKDKFRASHQSKDQGK